MPSKGADLLPQLRIVLVTDMENLGTAPKLPFNILASLTIKLSGVINLSKSLLPIKNPLAPEKTSDWSLTCNKIIHRYLPV